MWDWESIDAENETEEDPEESGMVFKSYEEILRDRQDAENFQTVTSNMQVKVN